MDAVLPNDQQKLMFKTRFNFVYSKFVRNLNLDDRLITYTIHSHSLYFAAQSKNPN